MTSAAVPRVVPSGGSSNRSRLTDRELLEAIAARLANVEAIVERLTPPTPRLHREDVRLLRRLLPALWARYEGESVTAAELLEDEQIRELFGQVSPKSVGKTLARLSGVTSTGGLFLECRAGRAGCLWAVKNPAAALLSELSRDFKDTTSPRD